MQNGPQSMFRNVKVLDCSVRDGGHLNKWRFDFPLVKKLYDAVSLSGIDVIELGYRTSKGAMEDCGIWRHTSDDVIRSVVSGKPPLKIAVMGDIGKIKDEDFAKKEDSPVDIVRLAFYKDGLAEALALSDKLIDKGYVVTLNMMGVVQYDEKQIQATIERLRASNLDIIYIADSFGSLFPNETANLVKIFNEGTGKTIGFHPHNNLQLAFANTISAIEAGAEYVDCSVNGMGRGAGNLPIETILLFLNRYSPHRYDLIPLLDFIEKDFKMVKYDVDWGYDVPYLLSGMNKCHPSYPLKLMDKAYSIKDIFAILSNLKGDDMAGFDEKLLEKAIKGTVILNKRADIPVDLSKVKISIPQEKPPYVGRHGGRDFLVIANGPTLNEYGAQIAAFAKKNGLVLIGSNFLGKKFAPDYHVFNNFERFRQYVSTVDPKSKVMVGSYLAGHLKNLPQQLEFETIEYVAHPGFDIKNGIIYSEPSTVAMLMLPLAMVMGARNIYVCGMDGYKSEKSATHFYDEKTVARLDDNATLQKKMECELAAMHSYQLQHKMPPFRIITPTSFAGYYEKGLI